MKRRGGGGPNFHPHRRFFSSLEHLQTRLSSEPNATATAPTTSSPSPSLLFLHDRQPISPAASSPPPEFLSQSPHGEPADDLHRLIGLLGLSAEAEEEEDDEGECHCSGGGFYSKVAGARGPKCGRERKRVDRWIRRYRRAGSEPARLAYLLLGKAASSGGIGRSDLGEIAFPTAVEEHLEHKPPASIGSDSELVRLGRSPRPP